MNREVELALVARLQAGDPAAFDAIHDEFNTRLFNFLARLSRRRDVAEDLLEETWLRFVAQSSRLRSDTTLGPWLFTVARNLYASYRRSRQIEDSHAGGVIGLWPCGSTVPSPLESTLASETLHQIEAALGALPVLYREAVLLVAVEGLRPAEAAAVCGVSPETMRKRLSRARSLLGRTLDESNRPVLSMLKEVTT